MKRIFFSKKIITLWVPLSFIATILFGALYAVSEHITRQNANDPQIRVAEDIVRALESGESPKKLAPNVVVPLETSLATFLTIYSNAREPIASTGTYNGTVLTPPQGVFDYTDEYTVNRVTWEPRSGSRFAIVVYKYIGKDSGYVLVGRSLREIEHRQVQLAPLIIGAWLIAVVGIYCILILLAWLDERE
jgi:hypothetical protein